MSDNSRRVSDCGCWTDAQGYWRLSDKCYQEERQAWAKMMERLRSSNSKNWYQGDNSVPATPHDRAVAYFWQELGRATRELDKK